MARMLQFTLYLLLVTSFTLIGLYTMMMIEKDYVWRLTIKSKKGVFRALDALSYCVVLAILWVFSSHYLRVASMVKLVMQ